ncbi:inositol monophosphatase [Nanchangia anserum]|uniref:Inositol monophosphatase n=1 Tax=Nanchangia anserum TaxID=2692125 RepID=A0A8I0KN81_9ACTO|nr:inositol monophosphatase [Nanchangia anserum]MBD3689001.1 inositol monophosphatase [Nanchangia anserum]QOX81249.1 inositol monophosphatase [Nanchangia anserum]
MPTPSPAVLADIAHACAIEAGRYISSVFRTDVDVETKADAHDPVTRHDRETEALISAYLARHTPGARILGEEGGTRSLAGSGCEEVSWIVDPIDGTANFAAGIAYLATSIAAEVSGRVVAACVHQPITTECYWADDHTGWRTTPHGHVRALRRPGPTREIDALATGYFPHRDPDTTRRHALADSLARLADAYASLRSPGACALDLAHVAAGFAGVATATFVQPWDVAAGFHLVRVSGGRVHTYDRGTGRPAHLSPAFVASAAGLDAATAREVFDEAGDTWLGPVPASA